MRAPVIVDGRNLFAPAVMAEGFEYCALGYGDAALAGAWWKAKRDS